MWRLLRLFASSTDHRSYMARVFGASEARHAAWRRFQASLLGALISLCATHINLQSTPHEKDWTGIELLEKVRSVFSQSGDETVQLSTFDKFLSLQLTGRPLRRYIEELAVTRREHKNAASFAPDISNELFLMIILIRMYTDSGGAKITRSDNSVYCASRYDMFFRNDATCCKKLFEKLDNNDFKGALLLLTRFAESIADDTGLSRGLVRQQTRAAVAAAVQEEYYAYNSSSPSRPRGAKKKLSSGARRPFKMLCGNCGKSDCSAYRCTRPCQACGGDEADHKAKDCPILSTGKGSYIKWHAACIKRGITPHGRAPRASRPSSTETAGAVHSECGSSCEESKSDNVWGDMTPFDHDTAVCGVAAELAELQFTLDDVDDIDMTTTCAPVEAKGGSGLQFDTDSSENEIAACVDFFFGASNSDLLDSNGTAIEVPRAIREPFAFGDSPSAMELSRRDSIVALYLQVQETGARCGIRLSNSSPSRA